MLITLDNNSTQYTQFSYPGGEWQVRLPDDFTVPQGESLDILARITSADDLVKLGLLCTAVPSHPRIILPYLSYSRADRRFTRNDCAGLANFAGNIVGLYPRDVVTLDVHNPETTKLLFGGHITNVLSEPLVTQAATDFSRGHRGLTILYPDAGAARRYGFPLIPQDIQHLVVLNCEKKRDPVSGEFQGFTVPQVRQDYPILIVDDLCDGGGTFVGIADELHKQGFTGSLGLYVSHLIQFQAVGRLVRSGFTQVYTTNSFAKWDESQDHRDILTIYDVIPMLTQG